MDYGEARPNVCERPVRYNFLDQVVDYFHNLFIMDNMINETAETALAMINNYICTKQTDKAESTFAAVKGMFPVRHESWEFFEKNEPCDLFGQDWDMEDLDGKSIEIFCDHGMGDTIQMLRYVAELKRLTSIAAENGGVKIVMNCLKNEPLQRLCDTQDYIDVFSKHHVKCDYHTNIMQLPKFYHGFFLWRDILEHEHNIPIPKQPLLTPFTETTFDGKQFGFGLKYNSDMNSKLFLKKSIWPHEFGTHWNYASLEPDAEWQNFVEVGDVADLVSVMATLPTIVSVDTLTLHLAGSMRLPTIGLLCHDADARWGKEDKTPWYPTVKLLRQSDFGNQMGCWKKVVKELQNQLTN